MRNLGLLFLVGTVSFIGSHTFPAAGGANGGQGGETAFLDLPGGIGYGEEEEQEPELIEFYNNQYEGDAFFFLLDRSSSMGQTLPSGKMKFSILKQEVIEAVQGLTSRSVVTIHFYDRTQQQLTIGNPPIKMDAAGKARVISRVAGIQHLSGSCMARGADKIFSIANKTEDKAHRTMILVGDGGTTCPNDTADPDAVFQRIMSRNHLNIPINTIYTGHQPAQGTEQPELLKKISRATNGTYKVSPNA